MKVSNQPNQLRQSSNFKKSLSKLNQQKYSEIGNQSMISKSLPKLSKSSSMAHSITTVIDNISQLISFLITAKIHPDKEVNLIDSLKPYLLLLKQHLKTDLLVIKPNKLDKNQISNFNLNICTKKNEIPQIKNLHSQKYRNKILIPIENFSTMINEKNYSEMLNNKNGNAKLQKQIYKIPYLKKEISGNLNEKILCNDKKQPASKIVIKQKDEELAKKSEFQGELKKKKITRVKTQSQKDDTIQAEQNSIKIIQKLKQKISSHELLIEKLKKKLKIFENALVKNKNIPEKDTKEVNKLQTSQQPKLQNQKGFQEKQGEKQVEQETQKQEKTLRTLQTHQSDTTQTEKSQIDILKDQLQARQNELMSLWALIHNSEINIYS